MKIIVAHNLYRSDSPSGENRVVAEEISRLRAAGIETVAYLKSSDDIVGLRQLAEAATGPIYARVAAREFADMLKHEQPSLVHLHNVFPVQIYEETFPTFFRGCFCVRGFWLNG